MAAAKHIDRRIGGGGLLRPARRARVRIEFPPALRGFLRIINPKSIRGGPAGTTGAGGIEWLEFTDPADQVDVRADGDRGGE